ncbi:MAG: Gfo/Idh/MocA family oxidoreductase [Acidimicrobiales bacterium]|nr:Gfo/Idh/MocA family oxidoreductase [Acidimicrobiales bacterium]
MARYAFAGAGWITAVHALAIDTLDDAKVVAVASRTAESAAARVGQTGGRVVSYDELPADADLVIVATPPRRHAVDALRAMANGAAAVVEKPLCATLDDADRLVRVVEAGGVLTYAENLLFSPAVERALAEIRTLGPLTHLSTRAMQARPTWGSFTSRSWGGGVLFDLGVHPLAVVVRAAAPARPVAVWAAFERSPDIEVEDRASVHLRFDNGLVAQVEASWREQEPLWDLQGASEDGVVYLGLLPEIVLERSGEPVEIPVPPTGDAAPQLASLGYVDQLRDAEAAWRVGRSSTVSDVYLGRDLLEIVCAASVSAAEDSREVDLPFDGARDRTPVELWDPDH